MSAGLWSFELWTPGQRLADGTWLPGVQVADLGGQAKNRRLTETRNAAEQIAFQLDLAQFEAYARELHVHPATLLRPGWTEVRVRRGGSYLCGGFVAARSLRITPDSQDIEVRANGFLNRLKKRKTASLRIYRQVSATDIAWSLIDESQSRGPAWDFGIRRGEVAVVGVHDRMYQDANIKDALVNLTEVDVAPFDMRFTEDKVFHTFAQIGAVRSDLVLEYPGGVIRSLESPLDASEVTNRLDVLGQGSGFSDADAEQAAARVTVEDTESQSDFFVQEDTLAQSSVSDVTTLEQNGRSYVAAYAYPLEVPRLTLDGNRAPVVTDYGVGDYVPVKLGGYQSIEHVRGLFRIEQREIAIDEDNVETVTLGVAQ